MMRNIFLLTLFALCVSPASGFDLKDIQRSGALRVIAVKDEAPQMFRLSGSGEPGLEREMLEGFAKLHDIVLEPVEVATSPERIAALLRGDGDVIVGIVDTPERRRQIAFTQEIVPVHHLAVTCRPTPVVRSVEAFRQKKVGVLDGTSWKREAIAAGVPVEEMILFEDRNPMLDALEAGQITATVMTTTDFLNAARERPCLEGGETLGAPGTAGWGVRKEATDLQAALNEYISNSRAGSSWNRRIVKYFGENALRALGRE